MQPVRCRNDVGRQPPRVYSWLTDDDHPRGYIEALRQRLEVRNLKPDGRRKRHGRSGKAQAKARRPTLCFAMLVGKAKRLCWPSDVEQQRVWYDDEEDIDRVRARDHVFETYAILRDPLAEIGRRTSCP